MPASTRRAFVMNRLILFVMISGMVAWEPTAAASEFEFFESRIRPLLVEHCYECHSDDAGESSGGLNLDTAAATLAGGLTGPAIVPGDSAGSYLMHVVRYDDVEMQMPPAGKLDDADIDALRQWIDDGAADPRTGGVVVAGSSPLDRDPQSHWAFVPPVRQPGRVPVDADTAADPIDAAVQQTAASENLTIAPEADDQTLIRRLYFDLSGLPPTIDQIRQFVDSTRPDNFDRLVDKLLAAPEFGERFGRHWLDVARYADTRGYAPDGIASELPGAYRYRDWVIAAFSGDMPYDSMIRHQIAGDRTDPDNAAGNLDAMGFLTLGRRFINPYDTADDRIDVITRGLLGMTVTCARCHDHKFDPIPTTDYYALLGVIDSSREVDDGPSPVMMVDKDEPRDQRVFVRGSPGNRGDVAPRQFLTALRRADEPRFSDGSGRVELAERIADPNNPLTARVMVNRVWQILIGRPLVNSPSDFGFRTEPPAVPGILDDLATDFATDFSIKRLVRRIVKTHVYRQQAMVVEPSSDPANRYFTRANPRRRDFESMRDTMLAIASHLDHRIGGAASDITRDDPSPRRTVYAEIDRQNLPGMFRTFDFASPDTHSPGRYETTVPQQGLYLLNAPQTIQLSRWIADRAAGNADPVGALFAAVLQRTPTPTERSMFENFVRESTRPVDPPIDTRWSWQYGMARTEGDNLNVDSFEPLSVIAQDKYQYADEMPTDGPAGYAQLTRVGGHTPRRSGMAVVRRLRSPAAGRLVVRMQLQHTSDNGDGVRFAMHVDGKQQFQRHVQSAKQPYGPQSVQVDAGSLVDFAADNFRNDNSDGFRWTITATLRTDDGRVIDIQSEKDFTTGSRPPAVEPPSRLAQAAQVLLMSNELAFVD